MPRRIRGAKNRSMVKRRTRKRVARRKQVRNRTSVPVGLGFPKRMVMTHKYSDQIAINTAASGGLNSVIWSCNSMFDPYDPVGGHQPLYFDQMAALYNHYTVIGSKIIIRATKTDGSTTVPVIVGAYINDDNSVGSSNVYALIEQSNSKHRIITGYKPTTTFNMKWSAKKTFGGSILANNRLQGSSAGAPAEQSYYTVYFDSSANITLTQVTFDVEIHYIAIWEELKDINSS